MCLHRKTVNPRINRRQIPECVLSCLVAAVSVPTERAAPPDPWALNILWEGKSPSFPTDNCSCQRLRLGLLILVTVCCASEKLQYPEGTASRFVGFFSTVCLPKGHRLLFLLSIQAKIVSEVLHQSPSFRKFWFYVEGCRLGQCPSTLLVLSNLITSTAR